MIEPLRQCVEEINIVLVKENMISEAERWLSGCEHCADNAVITLDYVLDALSGSDPTITEYVMCRPARCPSCSSELTEKALVAV